MTYCIINSLAEANKARNLFWDPDNLLTGLFFSNELAGETGEACNIVKKLERERLGLRGSRSSTYQLGQELGDVIICASLVAVKYNLDLRQFTIDKFNDKSDELSIPVRLIG